MSPSRQRLPRPTAGFFVGRGRAGRVPGLVPAALLLVAACGCGAVPSRHFPRSPAPERPEAPAAPGRAVTLHLAGSDTLLHVAAAWAEAYHATHPRVTVTVVGGGSGVGIQGLLLGVDDIALASRPAGAAEQAEARRRGFTLVGTSVARDAVVVVVHPSNPVRFLSQSQLRRIFSGEVRNWREVGGPDLPLLAFSRGFSSGTGQIFREVIFGPGGSGAEGGAGQAGTDAAGAGGGGAGEAGTGGAGGRDGGAGQAQPRGAGVVQVPGSALLQEEVARQPGAVGYLGLAYLTPRVRPVAVATPDGAPPVAPTPENLLTGRYPLTRPLWFYTRGEPAGPAADFIRFVLSPEGQRIAREHGYLPR